MTLMQQKDELEVAAARIKNMKNQYDFIERDFTLKVKKLQKEFVQSNREAILKRVKQYEGKKFYRDELNLIASKVKCFVRTLAIHYFSAEGEVDIIIPDDFNVLLSLCGYEVVTHTITNGAHFEQFYKILPVV